MLKLKSYSFPSERIAPVLWILCISRNDDNRRRFYFSSVYYYGTRIYTPTRRSLSRLRDRGGRFVRSDVSAHVVQIGSNVSQPRLNDLAHANRVQRHVGARYAAWDETCTCAITCIVRPSVSTPSGIVHRASARRVHYQKPSSKSFTRYSHTHHASPYRLSAIAYTHAWFMSIAIDEIISAASNRIICTFRRARGMHLLFRATSTDLSVDMYFSRFENDWPSELSSPHMRQSTLQ